MFELLFLKSYQCSLFYSFLKKTLKLYNNKVISCQLFFFWHLRIWTNLFRWGGGLIRILRRIFHCRHRAVSKRWRDDSPPRAQILERRKIVGGNIKLLERTYCFTNRSFDTRHLSLCLGALYTVLFPSTFHFFSQMPTFVVGFVNITSYLLYINCFLKIIGKHIFIEI